jgi:hypothetical protein
LEALSGFIKLHRRVRDNWIWEHPDYFKAWIDILLEVNYKSKSVRIGNKILTCERGQSVNSLDTWAKKWGWHKSKVRRFFSLLEQDGMIVTKSETQTTRITVCNYGAYNDPWNASETNVKRKRNAAETQLTPTKEGKKVIKKEKKDIGATKYKGRAEQIKEIIPLLDDLQIKYPLVNVADEFDKWKNYVSAHNKIYKRYLSAFKYWLGNAKSFSGSESAEDQIRRIRG